MSLTPVLQHRRGCFRAVFSSFHSRLSSFQQRIYWLALPPLIIENLGGFFFLLFLFLFYFLFLFFILYYFILFFILIIIIVGRTILGEGAVSWEQAPLQGSALGSGCRAGQWHMHRDIFLVAQDLCDLVTWVNG